MSTSTDLRIRQFLAAHTTMTLATVSEDGRPQAAALFYAEMDDFSCVFVSEQKVRHSHNLLHDSRVAATIHADGQQWQTIQGLQIEGRCIRLTGAAVETARNVYTDKYPFLKTHKLLGVALHFGTFYQLLPDWIRLIDNSLGFGHKEEWRSVLAR